MAGVIHQLQDILTQELECYEGLETLADYKREAIIKKDIDFLNQVIEREEEFVGRVTLLEKKREQLLREIAGITGLSYTTVTLTQILEKFGDGAAIKEEFESIRKELKEIIPRLKEKNDLNKELLIESMEFVNFTINAIQSTRRADVTSNHYVKEGNNISLEGQSFFDTKQ